MIVVDVNMLLYAVISSFPHHTRAHAWWEQSVNSAAEIGLAAPALFGFLRLSTNPRILESPLPVERAVGYVRDWLDQPNVRFLSPGPRHLEIAFAMLVGLGTAGNLTTDVQLAAHAVEQDAELHSNDTDFGRFSDLRWVNPLQ
ncbi:MAG: type II toxin-antitoxin system VapC family toxin [Jiangellaceae bacterium]